MKKKSIRFFVMAFLMITSMLTVSGVFSQTIRGKVISADSMPLSGVTIQLTGTRTYAISDEAGNYNITIGNSKSPLLFTLVGFESQIIKPGTSTIINLKMVQKNLNLDEVTVTALGIKKETKTLGYAIQEVKGDALTKAREPDAFNSLVGKVAGLTIGTSPEMLGRPNIVMRGNTDLLIVVDGIPINSDTWNISADDIESMSVLKGPNAAALYGFRGQNGAIVINTKKGSKDAKGWQVEFNSTNQLEKGWIVLPKDQTEYGRGNGFKYTYGNGLYDNSQRLAVWGPRFEGQPVLQYNSPYNASTNTRTATPYLSVGGNNYKNFIEAGFLSNNNISLSTSGAHSDLRISYSHLYDKGTGPNTSFNMDYLNAYLDYDISSKVRFESNINLNVQYSPNIPDADYGPNSYVYMFNVYGPADYDVRDLKNYYKGPMGVNGLMQYNENYGRSNNPYFMAYQWLRTHYKTDVVGFAKVTYNISKELSASIRTQYTGWNTTREEKVPAGTVLNQYLPWYYFGWYGDYRLDQRSLMENNTDFLLSYNKKVNQDWTIGANAGASWRTFKYNSSWATTQDLAVPGVYNLSNSQNPDYAYNFGSNMQVYSGYYTAEARYKNYFTLNTTGRVDKLSTLPSGNNTFFYPSVSASSVLSDYMKMPKAISFLKIRASYADVRGGLTQSQIGSSYTALTGNSLGNLLGYGFDYNTSYDGPSYKNQSAYGITTYYNNQPAVNYSSLISNPNLKSFDVKSYEAGLDFRMFQNRIGLDLTYFQSENGPQIFQLPVSNATGFTSANVNAVTTLKKGWEIALNAVPVKTHDFKWDMMINWSTYIETLKSIYGGEKGIAIGNHTYTIGERMDNFYSTGFVRDGSGNIVYNSGGAPLNAPSGLSNNIFLGHLNPDFSFGFNNRFTYKSFSFSFQFDGRVGGKIYDDVWYHAMNGGTAIESDQGDFKTARYAEWESTNTGNTTATPAYVGKGVVISSGTPSFTNGQINNLSQLGFAPNTKAVTVQSYLSSLLGSNFDEYYMISRTYVKLREVQLTYNFPRKVLGRLIKNASVSLVGRNLLYFAKRKDFDIDQYASGYNAQSVSQTGTSSDVTLSSPTFRRYGLNLNIGF